jgi:carbamoyl-phosphate synthase large subunit
MIKENGERPVTIIGTDMDPEAVGRFICDDFHVVPPGDSPDYIPALLDIVRREKPDVVFPESSNEVPSLARARGEFEALSARVLVSSPEAIEASSNKYLMYETIRKKTDMDLPEFHSASNLDDFMSAADKLGYPEKPVVFKPHVGKGSRGVRIIDPRADRMKQLFHEKPISKFMSMEGFTEIFEDVSDDRFPDLLVMEYLEGMEKTSDSICFEGRELLTTVKTVEQARWGVIVRGELVRSEALLKQTETILQAIPLSYCINLQFIADKLVEINPRVSTFIYQRDLIAPYLAIKFALGELSEDEVSAYRSKIEYGRRMVRYMDQLFHRDGDRVL